MSSTLSKIVMVIAIACLGNYGREWARLMLAEFRIASEEGRPLSFAFQCLWRALREMPKHQEGRLALGRYGVALFLMLPIAAILTAGAIGGYPFINLPGLHPHAASEWAPGGVNEGNRFAMQTLTPNYINSYWATEHGGIVWSRCHGNEAQRLRADARSWPLPWIDGNVLVRTPADGSWRSAADGEQGERPAEGLGRLAEVLATSPPRPLVIAAPSAAVAEDAVR